MQNPVVCRPHKLASQGYKRTFFGLLLSNSVGITTPSSIPYVGHTGVCAVTRDENLTQAS